MSWLQLHHHEPERVVDDGALVAVGRLLQSQHYRFTAVSPATHARHVRARGHGVVAHSLRDVFGWNLPFARDGVFGDLAALLDAAGALQVVHTSRSTQRQLVRSGLRCASLSTSTGQIGTVGAVAEQLFFHSAWPQDAADAVVVSPETVRFCRLLERRVVGRVGRVLDVGAGSGAAGILLGGRAREVVLADDNPEALRLAQVNADLARVDVDIVAAAGIDDVDGRFDLIVANPSGSTDRRVSRAAWLSPQGSLGFEPATRAVTEGVRRLAPGGRLIVVTRTPIVDGRDLFHDSIAAVVADHDVAYDELEADVASEEIGDGAWADVERCAVVCLDVEVP